jgi:uncharacterized membrane protein
MPRFARCKASTALSQNGGGVTAFCPIPILSGTKPLYRPLLVTMSTAVPPPGAGAKVMK